MRAWSRSSVVVLGGSMVVGSKDGEDGSGRRAVISVFARLESRKRVALMG